MESKQKKKVIIIAIIILLLLSGFIYLLQIRSEFKDYLSERYPQQSFQVGLVNIEPIYGNYYSKVTCMDDGVSFNINKSFNTQNINEHYLQTKSQIQYNKLIVDIFSTTELNKHITSVTGGGKELFADPGNYDQINLYLSEDTELVFTAKKALTILKENGVSIDIMILTQEKDGHIYELKVSTRDYSLSEEKLREKIMQVK